MSAFTSHRRRFLAQSAAALGLASAWPMVQAQSAAWPNKPIKLVVTFAPGGASDIVGRVIGEQLSKKLGQPIVVENKPGAGGTVGGLQVANAPADGYTFMVSNTTPNAIGPYTLEKQPYDPASVFTHVANLGSAPLIIMASKSSGIRSFADLLAKAKAEGTLNFGSGGPGSVGHMEGELIRQTTGANMVHVPYRGGAPMTTDLIAGVVPVGIDVITAFVQLVKKGDVIALAVTGAQRSPLLPEVPTVGELGLAALRFDNFFGVSGPLNLPADVTARLNSACNEVMQDPAILARLKDLGITPNNQSPTEFQTFVNQQVHTLQPLVKNAGIKL